MKKTIIILAAVLFASCSKNKNNYTPTTNKRIIYATPIKANAFTIMRMVNDTTFTDPKLQVYPATSVQSLIVDANDTFMVAYSAIDNDTNGVDILIHVETPDGVTIPHQQLRYQHLGPFYNKVIVVR